MLPTSADHSAEIDVPSALEGTELLCPSCGFDLRATPGEICGECGSAIDRASLSQSGFPWAHRRQIGRIRAYVRTVWLVSIGSRRLAMETARPQDFRDGRSFARVTAALFAVSMLIAGDAWVIAEGGWLAAWRQIDPMPRGPIQTPDWTLDFYLPWAAGGQIAPVWLVCIVLFAMYVMGAPRSAFASRSHGSQRRARAAAISYYASAPIAWIFPATLLGLASWALTLDSVRRSLGIGTWRPAPELAMDSNLAARVLLYGSAINVLFQMGRWVARVHHGGFIRGVVGLLHVVTLWCIGAVLMLGGLPWCVGFLWTLIDSLR